MGTANHARDFLSTLLIGALSLALFACSAEGFVSPTVKLTDALTVRAIGAEGGNPDDGKLNSHETIDLMVTLYNQTEKLVAIDDTFLVSNVSELTVVNSDEECFIAFRADCIDFEGGSEMTFRVGRVRVSPEAKGEYTITLRVTGKLRMQEEDSESGAKESWEAFEREVPLKIVVEEASPKYGISLFERAGDPIEENGVVYYPYKFRAINQAEQNGIEPSVTITASPENCCRLNLWYERGGDIGSIEIGVKSETYNWVMAGGKEAGDERFWLGVGSSNPPTKVIFTFHDDSKRSFEPAEVVFQ